MECLRVVYVRGNAFLSEKLLDPLAVGHPDHEQVVHVRDIGCLRGNPAPASASLDRYRSAMLLRLSFQASRCGSFTRRIAAWISSRRLL